MDQNDYDVTIERFLEGAKTVEDSKRPGYTTGTDDVLSNFKRIAEQTGTIPEKIALVYMLKHLDSVRTLLTNIEKGIDNDDPEPWRGRFHDILNYVKLMYALLDERTSSPIGPQRPTNGGSRQ